MDRIGRVVGWDGGVATVELRSTVGECGGGGCGSCLGPDGGLLLRIPASRPVAAGDRVTVRSLEGFHQSLRWLGFLAAFTGVLSFTSSWWPQAAAEGAPQRWAILAGLLAGAAAWLALRRWSTGRSRNRLIQRDRPMSRA